jgi:type IV secretory pathway VirB3-like protein
MEQQKALSEQRERLRSEAAQIQQESWLAAELHYAAETPWYHANLIIGIPATVLAAIAGAAAFSKLANSEFVAGSISIIVAILSSLTTFIDPKKAFAEHHASAKGFESLHHRAGFFYRVSSLDNDATNAELQKQLEEFRSSFIELNQRSLPISAVAHRHARAVVEGTRKGEVIRPTQSSISPS